MKNKEKGFTLIELLAVIVILAVIALISVPLIINIIDNVKKESYKQSIESALRGAELYIAKNPNEDITQGIEVTKLGLKNNNFTSGKIKETKDGILIADKLTNGNYCGGGINGQITVMVGSCDSLDITPPLNVEILTNLVTSTSITIGVTVVEEESGIKGYLYSINDSEYTSLTNTNIYTFNNLKKETEYKIKVKVINNNNLETETTKTIKTTSLTIPSPTQDIKGWTNKDVTVTINYPIDEGYNKYYTKDTEPKVEVKENTTKVVFNKVGTLLIEMIDNEDNVKTLTYQVANIDKKTPTLTLPSDDAIDLEITEYDLMKDVTCIDSQNTCTVTTSGTISFGIDGTYPIVYKGEDEAGNKVSKTKNIIVEEGLPIGTQYKFDYTGSTQTFNVPKTGKYKIELWGAKGSDKGSYVGGLGTYLSGEINYVKGDIFYIQVGGMPVNDLGGYNGGGYDTSANKNYFAEGGGATDIRIIGGNWNKTEGINSRIMVAAGGGGADYRNYDSNIYSSGNGGHGGGLTGYKGSYTKIEAVCVKTDEPTQISNAPCNVGAWCPNFNIYCTNANSNPQFGNAGVCNHGSGGGGGYYTANCTAHIGGTGGSSFISGHTGCVAIKSETDQTPKTGCTTGSIDNNCSIHYSNYKFTNTAMIDGAGYSWANVKGNQVQMPKPDGTLYPLGQGHKGNGYAKITYLGK